MAEFLVRDLEDDVTNKLRKLARMHGHSMVEEVRDILRNAVVSQPDTKAKLGSRLARCFAGSGLQQEFQELRGNPIQPPSLDR